MCPADVCFIYGRVTLAMAVHNCCVCDIKWYCNASYMEVCIIINSVLLFCVNDKICQNVVRFVSL